MGTGSDKEYWEECIANAAEECGLEMTTEQLDEVAAAASEGHEHYGMAFYQPPDNDRIRDIERGHEATVKRLEDELETYRDNANTAIKQALRVHRDDSVSIGEYGEVMLHGGRSTRIQ